MDKDKSHSRAVLKGNKSNDRKSGKVKKLLPSTRTGLMELLVSLFLFRLSLVSLCTVNIRKKKLLQRSLCSVSVTCRSR